MKKLCYNKKKHKKPKIATKNNSFPEEKKKLLYDGVEINIAMNLEKNDYERSQNANHQENGVKAESNSQIAKNDQSEVGNL